MGMPKDVSCGGVFQRDVLNLLRGTHSQVKGHRAAEPTRSSMATARPFWGWAGLLPHPTVCQRSGRQQQCQFDPRSPSPGDKDLG